MKTINNNPIKQAETNRFGGKNPHGLYVPLTDTELDVLERLALQQDFKVQIVGWGFVQNFQLGVYSPETWRGDPLVCFGDKRMSFYFTLNLSAPAVPQPNWYFDMELWARGHRLFGPTRYPTTINGNPIEVAAGMSISMALDVAIDQIDPKLIREIKPGTVGLTTRHGNMHLSVEDQRILANLQKQEKRVRQMTVQESVDVTRRSLGK